MGINIKRETKRETGTFTFFAFNRDEAAMSLDCMFRNRQPEPAASLRSGFVGFIETFENMG
jgi:hypothetical protein